MPCALCGENAPGERFSGLDLCARCAVATSAAATSPSTGPTLTVSVVPLTVMRTSDAAYRRLDLETAALALHLKEAFA